MPLDDWRSLVRDRCALLWVDAREFSDEELDSVARAFDLHEVALDSVKDSYHRPHLYEFHDHFYINLTVIHDGRRAEVDASEQHLFVGEGFVVTVTRDRDSEAVDAALDEYRRTPALCDRGSIYAVYLLADNLVETYFPVVEKLDDDADSLEDDMLGNPDQDSLERLFNMKRRGYEMRKLLGPQRDVFSQLSRRDFPFIQGENQVYFQDVYNRMIRIFDTMDTVREILSGSLDIYLSSVSNRLNEIMKVLTVAAVILGVLTFITGFYGMNFTHLPALEARYGPWAIVGLMVLLTGGLLWWFRWRKWL